MTRDEIYQKCVEEIDKVNCLLLQAATGFGDISNRFRKT